MRAIVLSKNFEVVTPEARLAMSRRRWVLGLTVSASAAFVTVLLGLTLAAASLLHLVPPGSKPAIYGTVLLVVTFPLMFFAAHCLDMIDEVNRAIRSITDITR